MRRRWRNKRWNIKNKRKGRWRNRRRNRWRRDGEGREGRRRRRGGERRISIKYVVNMMIKSKYIL